jgi:CDP-diacylglycerol--serine O-phosphatidyltransferase
MDNPTPAKLPTKANRKGIYLLPNLFTSTTLFGGFFAIIMAMQGDFHSAACGILAAMVADSLDGRIARLTHTSTDFGKEYDSLADLVAFGVASGLLMYIWSLEYLSNSAYLGGKLGWVISFIYVVCTALRLARFNVLTTISGAKSDFFGLPSPAAAGTVTFFMWSMDKQGYLGQEPVMVTLTAVLTLCIALLMVSNFRYNSFKKMNLEGRMRFLPFLAVLGALVLITINPPIVLFAIFFLYAMSGPFFTVVRWLRRRPAA